MSAYPNRLRPLCVRTPSLRRAVALQDLISLQTGRSAKCFHLGLEPFGVGAPLGLIVSRSRIVKGAPGMSRSKQSVTSLVFLAA